MKCKIIFLVYCSISRMVFTVLFISIFVCSSQGTVFPAFVDLVESGNFQNRQSDHTLSRISIRKRFPDKAFIVQDWGEIEYIPLETRADVLLDGASSHHYYVSDSLIITYNRDGGVFVFNRNGKVLNTFNYRGRGPEEYWELRAMTVDFQRKEFYIFDYPGYSRIRVYTFDGAYKRTLETPGKMLGGLYIYNYGDYLLCYDRTKDKSNLDKNGKGENLNPQPYFFLDKETSQVVKVNIYLKNFVPDQVLTLIENKKQMVTSWAGFFPVCKNGEQVYLSDAGLDTIYKLRGMTAVPFMVKDPSVEDRDPALLAWIRIKTNRFTFLKSMEKKFVPGVGHFSSAINTVYDHKTGEGYDPGSVFIDTNFLRSGVDLDHYMDELPENYAKAVLSPLKILKAYDEGRLRGRLKEIASQLKEDDNPVLMLVKFRD